MYENWLANVDDEEVLNELYSMKDDEKKKDDCFGSFLSFGTSGLRGVIGAGTNNMNIYTVARATKGLGEYLLNNYSNPSIAIGYDTRNKSDVFAKLAASILAAKGIKVYISNGIIPTPILAYSIRNIGTSAGIIITASHNPCIYNGYKVYDHNGCGITDDEAFLISSFIDKEDYFNTSISNFENGIKNGKINYIDNKVIEDYYETILKYSYNLECISKANLKVLYTPLHGTGMKHVECILKEIGIKNLSIVSSQEKPDKDFKTIFYPNPEFLNTFEEAIKYARDINPDIIIATDPDADRLGLMVKNKDEYVKLNGNEVGYLFLNYILKNGNFKNGFTVKTIVTSTLIDKIAKKYGIDLFDVLIGFKYIGEKIDEKNSQFIFGFEEAIGYLIGDYIRDKDGISAAMLISEMASFYKLEGKTLFDVMNELYDEYGYYVCNTYNFEFKGSDGKRKMIDLMSQIRSKNLKNIHDKKVEVLNDYFLSKSINVKKGEEKSLNYPVSNILEFILEGGSKIVIRPSGTEPKMKMYFIITSENKKETIKLEQDLKEWFFGEIQISE